MGFPRDTKFKSEYLIIRVPKISDIVKLINCYHYLSERTKRFFHPFPENRFNFTWIILSLSCLKTIRRLLLKIVPRFVYLSLCSIYMNELVGFAFIKLANRFYGELGIFVRDDCQGMGIGTKLMDRLIKMAKKEGIKKVRLTVLADNYRAIRLYEKFGFKKIKIIRGGDVYRGEKHDCIEMWLNL